MRRGTAENAGDVVVCVVDINGEFEFDGRGRK